MAVRKTRCTGGGNLRLGAAAYSNPDRVQNPVRVIGDASHRLSILFKLTFCWSKIVIMFWYATIKGNLV